MLRYAPSETSAAPFPIPGRSSLRIDDGKSRPHAKTTPAHPLLRSSLSMDDSAASLMSSSMWIMMGTTFVCAMISSATATP